MTRLRPHPGEVLRDEYLVPFGLSVRAFSKELGIPANHLTEIMRRYARRNREHHNPARVLLWYRSALLVEHASRA